MSEKIQEEWKTIQEMPRYQISNYGRVKSRIGKEKIRKQETTAKGYKIISLYDKPPEKGEYKRKVFRIHRLVAKYFCEDYDPEKDVHHKNTDRSDNTAWNLQPLTRSEHLEIHKQINEQRKKERGE